MKIDVLLGATALSITFVDASPVLSMKALAHRGGYAVKFRQNTLTHIDHDHHKIHVHQHDSIQAAIDKAPIGSKIYIDDGTYKEQLTISTDGISLIANGPNVKIVLPDTPVHNICSGLAGTDNGVARQAGICIQGSNVNADPFPGFEHSKITSVGKTVNDVSVTGLTVTGFNGANIMVIGARNAFISRNNLLDGPSYGFLSAGSYNTVAENNVVSSKDLPLGFIALCM